MSHDAGAAAAGGSASTDHQGFVERADGTVMLFDSLDAEAVISVPAFHRLMSRILDVLVEAALASGAPGIGSPVWDEVRAAQRALVAQRAL